MSRHFATSEKGFTLVELLVVIAIIAVITAIAVPAFINQRQKAVDASLVSDVKTMAIAIETRLVDTPDAYWYGTSGNVGGLNLRVGISDTNQGESQFIPLTTGTHMRVEPVTGGAGRGFSIYAYNPNGSKYSSPSTTLTYRSINGGISANTISDKTGASFGKVE